MLATASDKGTVVRVYSIPDGQKLWQFRRGSSNARIWSINFNLASTLLAVSSDSSTIHIYRLKSPKGAKVPPEQVDDEARSPTPSEANPPALSPSLPGHTASSSLRRRSYHIGKSFVGGVGGYLPKSVSEMWEPQRDFAHIKLSGTQGRTVVAMSGWVILFTDVLREWVAYQQYRAPGHGHQQRWTVPGVQHRS